MPLFEYQCGTCSLKFEELRNQKEDNSAVPCKSCGSPSNRLMSSFSSVIAGGSPTETTDMMIGRESNKRWQTYHDRQSKRHDGKELKNFDLPKTKDGKYMPVMGLGDKETVEKRHEYVGALQEHRSKRIQKGIGQFKEAGEF
jgi:putative FmdB family regulatory protein